MIAITQYLQRYAESEAALTEGFPQRFESGVVLPCFDESWAMCGDLLQHDFENATLLVLVLNQPDDVEVCANNLQLRQSLLSHYSVSWQARNQQLTLLQNAANSILLVDRFSDHCKIPRKEGVGLARKVGADIALSLISAGKISCPWIHNIDADVILPTPYVTLAANTEKSVAAIILPFEHMHTCNVVLDSAQRVYDRHMNYYVAALLWAGSPYAYHSLGSTLIINASHYAQVRGFPKRSAGEDFHLLNKLRKAGDVNSLAAPAIKIHTRVSQRTPFGTGAAISDISRLEDAENDYRFYHPAIFSELKNFLTSLKELNYTPEQTMRSLPGHTRKILNSFNIDKAIQHAAMHSSTEQGFLKHMHIWFDALKTLQFVHALRDNTYASVTANELEQLLPTDLQV